MTNQLPTPPTHERPHFDEKKIAAAIKNIAKAADVADGHNDGIIHRAAATELLASEARHPTALSRDAGLSPKVLQSVLDGVKSLKDVRDEMPRPTNAQIDEMVHSMGQQLNAHVYTKTSVAPQVMVGRSVTATSVHPNNAPSAVECSETIAGFQVPSWVPDAITTKSCRAK